ENVPSAKVDKTAGSRSDSDHKIGSCRGHNQWHLHKQIHHWHLDRSAPNSQEPGKSTGHEGGTQPQWIIFGCVVGNLRRSDNRRPFITALTPQQRNGCVEKKGSKKNLKHSTIHISRKVGSYGGSHGRRQLQGHAQANVGSVALQMYRRAGH